MYLPFKNIEGNVTKASYYGADQANFTIKK